MLFIMFSAHKSTYGQDTLDIGGVWYRNDRQIIGPKSGQEAFYSVSQKGFIFSEPALVVSPCIGEYDPFPVCLYPFRKYRIIFACTW